MNFFRSGLFSDAGSSSPPSPVEGEEIGERSASGWNIGSFVKTLASKSGEVLQSYQRDLHEFGVGLKRETGFVAEVTANIVKDLPLSLETRAVVAQESLESVGQSLEEFGNSVWRGTADLISSVKEAVQQVDDEATPNSKPNVRRTREVPSSSGWKYSRYEAQVNAMQRDSSTYCDDPEEEDDYVVWLSSFNLSDRKEEIAAILQDNTFMLELQGRIVPLIVEYDAFWTRYFYRLHKLQQVEDARADLVKRATAAEEEELTWDVEEEMDDIRVDQESAQSITFSQQDNTPSRFVPKQDDGSHDEGLVPQSVVPVVTSLDVHKVEPSEITADQPVSANDNEEAVSEGSTGSDWLVIQEEKEHGVGGHKTLGEKAWTAQSATSPPLPGNGGVIEAVEPELELEDLGDLSIEEGQTGSSKTRTEKSALAVKFAEDTDWGDWE